MQKRILRFESLDGRLMMAADFDVLNRMGPIQQLVLPPVSSHHDLHGVPDFAKGGSPTLVGAGPESVVHLSGSATISAPTTVKSLGVHGVLTIASELRVKDLLVYPDGKVILKPGARILLRDIPIDTTADPDQWGTGINVFGTFIAEGTPKDPYVFAAGGLAEGHDFVVLQSAPKGWKVGDKLLIGDTQQRPLGSEYIDRNEVVIITQIKDNFIKFDRPLKFTHPELVSNPWNYKRTPPVANLSRDIVIESENPNGTRGHVAFHGSSQVVTNHVTFSNLGRTKTETISAENLSGRYPWHVHHFTGRATAEGNVVNGYLRWGMVIHDAVGQRLASNVVWGGNSGEINGAGIATEQGTEINNVITGNLSVGAKGSKEHYAAPQGHNSDGFWFRSPGNYIDNNYAFGNQGYGFHFNGYGRSATKHNEVETVHRAAPLNQPMLSFRGNEAASNTAALWMSWSEAMFHRDWKRQTVTDLFGWHNGYGMEAFHEGPATIARAVFISDPLVAAKNRGSNGALDFHRGIGINLSRYECFDWIFVRPRIYGFQIGYYGNTKTGREILVESAEFSNHVNVAIAKGLETTRFVDPLFLGDGDGVETGIRNLRLPIPDDPIDLFVVD